MKKYRLICMSFDGEYIKERPLFDSIDKAWEYSDNLGSKWFFYPFHFVTTESYKTIVSCNWSFDLEGKRTSNVKRTFLTHSLKPEMKNVDAETFAYSL